ncbi:SurA N-terminal domain-containing protein [Pseudovibrio exalbescens]|uniref:peptidylprolyl isomerase n=1 Tax=Pseudovibrio exalbescens TaxID=197461 RepID=UPI0023670C60|nr:peptidylprolyl isomerase [Pseudovibrio exalbescens]MDD7908597.1 SurA N-terminal domain-containing protein [Pseudovibrio exalbescens]
MLDALRKSVGTWFAKVLIGLLVISFAIWGIADVFTGFGNTSVAKVGDTEISSMEFEDAYRRQLDNLSRQLGQPITPEQGAAFGIPTQVLGQLIGEAALNDVATGLSLGVSDEAVIKTIQENPAFSGINGGFDRSRLAMVLRNAGISEDEFVVRQQAQAERLQLIDALVGGMVAPEALVKAFNHYSTEERKVAYLQLTNEILGDIGEPTEEELNAFFSDRISSYRAPEYRQVRFIEVTAEKIAQPEALTEEQVREEYERVKDRYQVQEQRRIYQLSFPSVEEAEAAAAEIAGGKSFEDIMAERNVDVSDVDLGLLGRAGFLDDTIGEAAFALAEGEVSPVIEGRFTTVLLKAVEINAADVQPLEEVADEIRTDLAQDIAADEIFDIYNEVEDARAGGSTFEEIAERFSLELVDAPAFDQSGRGLDEQQADLPARNELIAAAFNSDIGVENDALNIGRDGYLWFEVTAVTPERDRELSEVRDRVIKDWTAYRQAELLKQTSEEVLAEVNSGKSLDDVATERSLTVKSASGLLREQMTEVMGAEALNAVFSGPVGTKAEVAAQDGSRLVLEVTDITTPAMFEDSAPVRNLASQLSADLQNSLIGGFVDRVEQEAGVQVNQALFNQVTGVSR